MLYVCAALESIGEEVEVFCFDENTAVSEFPSGDIYAYSISSSASYPLYLSLAPKLKSKAKIHIAGNTHVTIFPEQVLNEMNLDAVFCGPGEKALTEWVQDGLKKRGVIKGSIIEELTLPFPARHLLPEKYVYMENRVGGKSKNSISMISSRGCTFQCRFCAIQNKGRVIYRNTNDFENEVKDILYRYLKCDGITLMDETFTFNTEHAINVSKVFGKYGLKWECNSRIDTLNEEIIKALSDNNCMEVRIGIETGSQKLLNLMSKGFDIDEAYETLVKIKLSGLKVKIYLMHGYPGEDSTTTNDTISFLQKVKPYIDRVSLYRFTPLPGSKVFDDCNLNIKDWSKYSIYNEGVQWWGTKAQYDEMDAAYYELKKIVDTINNK